MPQPRTRFFALSLLAILTAYALLAYVVVPALWQHYEHQPGLARLPMFTTTEFKVAGDPINLGVVGSNDELIAVMKAAGWVQADRLTLLSSGKNGAQRDAPSQLCKCTCECAILSKAASKTWLSRSCKEKTRAKGITSGFGKCLPKAGPFGSVPRLLIKALGFRILRGR
jgi:hypothetical protein